MHSSQCKGQQGLPELAASNLELDCTAWATCSLAEQECNSKTIWQLLAPAATTL